MDNFFDNIQDTQIVILLNTYKFENIDTYNDQFCTNLDYYLWRQFF